MSITINLSSADEARLLSAASQSGLDPEELARKLISEHLPAPSPVEEMRRRIREWQAEDHTPAPPVLPTRPGLSPTAALFAQWAEEDAQRTNEEIAEDDRFWQEFQQNINDGRR